MKRYFKKPVIPNAPEPMFPLRNLFCSMLLCTTENVHVQASFSNMFDVLFIYIHKWRHSQDHKGPSSGYCIIIVYSLIYHTRCKHYL
ncbi:hypothetical protein GDO86_011849 [Hymenochirus boettgeri]|uniref:Uncharacterized protein n=1 Tax=Hymenochirus boettgeri TaxID=247094 RepID=A0A8T2JHZ9_9PIPI|nr:hypothetical protein GDO86_011849 [Hymenochirus boettgeri]